METLISNRLAEPVHHTPECKTSEVIIQIITILFGSRLFTQLNLEHNPVTTIQMKIVHDNPFCET